jgi:hypothetical protein
VIPPLADWSFESQGGCIWLRPLDCPEASVIRYIERVRTVEPLEKLVGDFFVATSLLNPLVSDVEQLVTAEGELAAVATIDCTLAAKAVQVTFGCVWVDEFHSQTVGLALLPGQRSQVGAAVRRLVRGDTHMMTQRRRRYRHAAPMGWQATTRWGALNLVYLSPDGRSELTVAAAVPSTGPTHHEPITLSAHLEPEAGFRTIRVGETRCPRLQPGLRGRCFRLEVRFADGSEGDRRVVELHDRDYVYPMHLDSPSLASADSSFVLERVLGSISPLAPLAVQQDHERAATLFAWLVT